MVEEDEEDGGPRKSVSSTGGPEPGVSLPGASATCTLECVESRPSDPGTGGFSGAEASGDPSPIKCLRSRSASENVLCCLLVALPFSTGCSVAPSFSLVSPPDASALEEVGVEGAELAPAAGNAGAGDSKPVSRFPSLSDIPPSPIDLARPGELVGLGVRRTSSMALPCTAIKSDSSTSFSPVRDSGVDDDLTLFTCAAGEQREKTQPEQCLCKRQCRWQGLNSRIL